MLIYGGDVHMDFKTNMDNVIEYIESNLNDTIDYNIIAKKACCSIYHFQRVFSYIFGIPLAEYIRCRRMTLAAFELHQSDIKVIDLAVKCGYDSQSSFSRAFQAFHGCSPSEVRTGSNMIKALPRASININTNTGQNITYRIEKTKSSVWFGKSIKIEASEADAEKIFKKAFEFGNEIISEGTHGKIIEFAGMKKDSLLASIRYAFQDDGSQRFMYGAELCSQDMNEEYELLNIPDTLWAVFKHPYVVYPETTLPLYHQIYSEWFPTSEYVQTEGACIEKCYKDYIEVWIPITKVKHDKN